MKMNGNCKHEAYVVTETREWINGQQVITPVTPYVQLSNDDDSYYKQGFETREELEEFIAQLRAAGNQAFGG
jgi:hypothetical protein